MYTQPRMVMESGRLFISTRRSKVLREFSIRGNGHQTALPTKMKNMTRRELLAITPGLLLMDCSSATSPKVASKPPEPVSGLHALYQMYTFSRTWAQDLKVIRLSSV